MPEPGSFHLYPEVRPPITAGDYRWQLTESVQAGDVAGPVAAASPYLRVTSPRFTMPPDQLLSVFPPANAEGAFGARLPQVVLKRRTLPWERTPTAASDDARLPWLALVVFAEGEAELSVETDVAGCVTPGVTLTGHNDVPRGLYVEVTQTVLDSVFPTKDDLPLLVHAREVDKSDTELALGDDDGWMAVVLANRLPQPTTTVVDGKPVTTPVRYLAALVSLEGQTDVLPEETDVLDVFTAVDAIHDYAGVFRQTYGEVVPPDTYAMSDSIVGTAGDVLPHRKGRGRARTPKGPVARGALHSPVTGLTGGEPLADTWQVAREDVERAAAREDAFVAVRDVMAADWRFPIERVSIEPRYRFPCLAHWSFTTTDGASFEELMLGLDVGLLGTLPAEPEPVPGAPLPPPRTRPLPEATETGHVGLGHLTRRGDRTSAWYRGPLAPHVTDRDAKADDGSLPLAHASDHLRRVTPDGREDLTYAAAFEIGRLLALSQPSLVAGLMRWRAEQYGAERARRIATGAFAGVAEFADELRAVDVGRLLGDVLLEQVAVRPEDIVGPRRPLVDPGRAVPGLDDGGLDEVLATGLGVDLERVRVLAQRVGVAAALAEQDVPFVAQDLESPVLEGPELDVLRIAAESAVSGAAGAAVFGPTDDIRMRTGPRRRRTTPAPDRERPRDALDAALDRLQGEESP